MEELRRKGEGLREALVPPGGPCDRQWLDKDPLAAQGLVQLRQGRAFSPLKHQFLSFTVKHLIVNLLVKAQVLPTPLSSWAAPLLTPAISSSPRCFSSTGITFGYFFMWG